MTEIATILKNARTTFLSDVMGVLTLAAFTTGLLHLPGLL